MYDSSYYYYIIIVTVDKLATNQSVWLSVYAISFGSLVSWLDIGIVGAFFILTG